MRYFECHPIPVSHDPSTESGVGVAEVPTPVNMFKGDARRGAFGGFFSVNVRVELLPSVKPPTGNRINICIFLFHDTSPGLEFTGCERIHARR